MNKVVLITGTSTGFGRTAAETLAQRGYPVLATMRDTSGRNASGERPFRTVPTAAIQQLLEPYNALAETMRDVIARTFKAPELTVFQAGSTSV
jgi:NAD(P)-dependent dehydrogenase (short-subunit alcohol dehydrogenase family)